MKAFFSIFIFLIFMGCGGGENTTTEVPVYPPGCDENGCEPGGGDPPADQISYSEMQGHLNTYCAECHAQAAFMESERSLRNSSAYDRLFNRSMPPDNASRVMPEVIRVKAVNFFR